MGRHHCKVCCCSHALPQISNVKVVVDYSICDGIQQSPCILEDLEPGAAKVDAPMELVVATSDFSEEHVFHSVHLPRVVPEQTSGFWSKIYRGIGENQEPVVVKVYKRQENYSQRQVIDRFHREILALGTLGEHKEFVRCLGFGFTADLWPYIVMEDCGVPISALWRRGKAIAAKPLAEQLLAALEEMHVFGLCHCDIYEDNILLSPGTSRWSSGMTSSSHVSKSRFVARIVDWNSVQDCQLISDPHRADKDSGRHDHEDAARARREGGRDHRGPRRLLVVEGGGSAPVQPSGASSSTGASARRRAPPPPPGPAPLPAYARPTRCPVLSSRMLLPGKARELKGSMAEPLGALRDCQGVGRLVLKALDPRACESVFRAQHLGTLDDWRAAADSIAASRLKEPWKELLTLLFNPRALAAGPTTPAVPYPVPMARQLLDESSSSRFKLW